MGIPSVYGWVVSVAAFLLILGTILANNFLYYRLTTPHRLDLKIPPVLNKTFQHMTIKVSSDGYLCNFKNPCWYNESPKNISMVESHSPYDVDNLRCIPYFYMIGMAKSGSTTLCDCLQAHPEIAVPHLKELDFFKHKPQGSDVLLKYSEQFLKESADIFHSSLPQGDFHHKITFDCTPRNVWIVPWLPQQLSRLHRDARFIVLMRNPVDRLHSHYHHDCVLENVNCTMATFDTLARAGVKAFRECNKKNSVQKCVSTLPRYSPVVKSVYIGYLLQWLDKFPRSQFLFVRAEDLYRDVTDTMGKVFRFLDLAPPTDKINEALMKTIGGFLPPGLGRAVKSAENRTSALRQWESHKGTMWTSTRRLLEEFYAPYNRMLADLLQDKRFLFMDQRP